MEVASSDCGGLDELEMARTGAVCTFELVRESRAAFRTKQRACRDSAQQSQQIRQWKFIRAAIFSEHTKVKTNLMIGQDSLMERSDGEA